MMMRMFIIIYLFLIQFHVLYFYLFHISFFLMFAQHFFIFLFCLLFFS